MPLPKPAPRKMHHLRDIALRGYEREDGLVDVDVHLTDTKTYTGFNYETGPVPAGTPVHDMWLRLTVDINMTIIDCVASMDTTPHQICGGAAPGGSLGCTHLREILQQVATVAFQTMVSVRGQDLEAYKPLNTNALAGMLNTCHAFDEKSSVIAAFRERLGIA
jgi:hypothetical protein